MPKAPDLPALEPVVSRSEVPAGVLGPDPVAIEVRCFVVPGRDGVLVVDAGVPGTIDAIEAGLGRLGARWSDVTDVVLTHSHFDHVGGLADVISRAPRVQVWAGTVDVSAIQAGGGRVVRPLVEGDRVRDLVVLATPGHTAGHISLLQEAASFVLVGDVVGSVDGVLTFGPPAFTADAAQSRASLARVAELGAGRLVFSHGPEILDPNSAVRELLRSVASAVGDG